jgi:hypothetical protein
MNAEESKVVWRSFFRMVALMYMMARSGPAGESIGTPNVWCIILSSNLKIVREKESVIICDQIWGDMSDPSTFLLGVVEKEYCRMKDLFMSMVCLVGGVKLLREERQFGCLLW